MWLLAASSCALHGTPSTAPRAPQLLTGDFRDDYRGSFTISDSIWFQRPANRYRIVRWQADSQFLIAQNAADDPTAPGKWTRIDWISFIDQQPYTWGFCLTAWNAPTRDAALATPAPHRDTPRTGCNGFPFTRMQRVAATDSNATR
jgi:hypothetical protein